MQNFQTVQAAHPHDSAKQTEHDALLKLVPTGQATHIAVKSGSWFDPATWGGQIPGRNAKVWIPETVTVKYDGVSNQRLFTVRVDGSLAFATDADTKMILDTLVVAPKGRLTIGTQANPVQRTVESRIIIAENGAIDRTWDFQQLSRGVISHGTIEIHGQEKTSHLPVALAPKAGQSTINLDSVPQNWQVGDHIILTGTRYVPYEYDGTVGDWVSPGSEDEQRVITAINGDRITLDRPLDYDHTTPRSDLKAYVANQSRNVVIETENAEKLPANQRGHVMLMHSDNVDVRYAEFKNLGRTNKSRRLDDFKLDANENRVLDRNGKPIIGKRDNIRGRYALHLHRTGVNGNQAPAILVGNSIDGSPGWGITQHDSYAVLENNLTYNVAGAGFVSETGNEIGAWRNNISIQNFGGRDDNEKIGVGNQDQGFAGHGFWFQSRLVENQGNVTAGNRGSGMFYFHRGIDQIEVDANNLPLKAWAKGQTEIDPSDPPILGFHDNEVFASAHGLRVIKNFQRQEHDARTLLDGFKAWEVIQGTELQYTAHYTLKDFTLLGAKTINRTWFNEGFNLAQNTEDIVFDTLNVEGFERGVNLRKELVGEEPWKDWGYIWVDAQVKNNQQNWVNLDLATDQFLQRSDLRPGRLSFKLNPAKSNLVVTPRNDGYFAFINGSKTDSLGTIEGAFGSELLGYQYDGLRNLVAEGYYTLPEGKKGIVVDEYFSDRLTGDTRKYSFVLTFVEDYWTRGIPNLGPLDPTLIKNNNGIIEFEAITSNHPTFIEDTSNPNPSPLPLQLLVIPPLNQFKNTISGNDNANKLFGTDSRDLIEGQNNNDTLHGRNGKDYLRGGNGRDIINAGQGNDFLDGGAQSDTLRGSLGSDQIAGQQGHDQLNGGTGFDTLDGGTQNDTLRGGQGQDLLFGNRGNDWLHGGAQQDMFVLGIKYGTDIILDYQDNYDKIGLADGLTYADLSFASLSGSTVIQVEGNTIAGEQPTVIATLNDVSPSAFQANDFVNL